MNQKNSLGIDLCFKDLDNPMDLFEYWFNEAKKTEINDPNALALATVRKNGIPSVRMVLLKDFNEKGFVFYTNLNSRKSMEIKHVHQNCKSPQLEIHLFDYLVHCLDEDQL